MQGSKKKFRKSLRLEMKYENGTSHPQPPTVTPTVSTTTFTSTTTSGTIDSLLHACSKETKWNCAVCVEDNSRMDL